MPPQTFEETGFVSPDFRLSATNSTQSSAILHDDFPVVIPPKTTFYSPHSVKSTSARLGLGLVVVPTLIVGAPKSSSYRNASDRAEEPSGTVKPDAKYDESPVVATLSFVISTRLKMSPTLPSSCEGIMPDIISSGSFGATADVSYCRRVAAFIRLT